MAVILNAGDNGHNQHYYFRLCSYGSTAPLNLSFFWEFLRGGLFFKKRPPLKAGLGGSPSPLPVRDGQDIVNKRVAVKKAQAVKGKQSHCKQSQL